MRMTTAELEKEKDGAGGGLHGEGVCSPVVEDLNWVPSTYTGQLTTARNSSSGGPDALSGLWGHLCTRVCMHTHIRTHT